MPPERGEDRLLPAAPGERVEVRRLASWFNDKFHAEVSGPLVTERVFKRHMTQGTGRRAARHRGAARGAPQYPLSSGLYRLAGAHARLARRRPAELGRPGRGGASVRRRLPGRCAVERRRSRQELVRAGEVAALVPAAAGRHAGRTAAGEELRRSRLLNDPDAIKAALVAQARARGFDVAGVTKPDAVPEAKARLERFLADGAHGDMIWMETTAERRGSPAALWPDVRSVIMLGMNYGPDDDPLAILRAEGSRRDLGLCQGRRLSRTDQGAAEGRGALAGRACRRRGESVRRYRGGDGKAARRQSRPRLARQAHEFGVAPIRLVAVSRLDFHHARSAGRRRRAGHLRQLPRLSRHLPDRGLPRALPARCAALHFVSHHRAQGPDPARISRGDGQPHLWLRRLSRRLSVEQVRGARPRGQTRRARRLARAGARRLSRASTTRNSARCSPRPRSSAPAATVSCAMC